MSVQDLTPEIAEQLGVEGTDGVVVSSVDPTGPAREAGIRRGDVIVEIDQHEVKDSKSLHDQLSKSDERVLLLIRRGDSQLYVPLARETG
jgi:serine protease Do